MAQQIQLRRGTAAAWTTANPTLAAGEVGVETDTLKVKVGNGATAWVSLAYLTGSGGGGGGVSYQADAPVSPAVGAGWLDSDTLILTFWDGTAWVEAAGYSGYTPEVTSVNTFVGAVVLTADDIDDAAALKKFATATQLSAVDALGTMSTQAASAVAITGGSITGTNVVQSINDQTGTAYTLAASDAGKLVSLSNAAAVTLTVPQDSAATIAIGTYIDLHQFGVGQVTVVVGTGATLHTSGLTAKARAQYSRFGVQKVAANTWSLFGDLAAS